MISRSNYFVILILLLSIALRIYGINSESLWFDEAYSVHLSKMNLFDLIQNTAEDVHPPLYYIVLNLWGQIFGDSEVSSRALSIIFNVLTVFILYRIAAYLYDKKTGLAAAFILAVSPFHIYYSQETRMYALLGLLSILSIYYFIKLTAEINNNARWKYILFSALMLYTHIYGFWILCFEAAFILTLYFLKRIEYQKIRSLFLSIIIIFALYLPWSGILLSQMNKVKSGFWIPPRDWLVFPETLISFSGSLILFAIFILLLLSGFFTIKKLVIKDDAGKSKTIHALYFGDLKDEMFIWMWFIIPIIIPLIITQFYRPIFDAKYAIAASLGLYVLAARAIIKIKLAGLQPVILSAIFLFSLIAAFENANVQTKERWRDAIGYVNNHAEKTDYVIVNASKSDEIGIFDYYLNPELDHNKILIETCKQSHEPVKKKVLRAVEQKGDRFWFIKTGRDCGKGFLLEILSEKYEIAERESFPSVFRRYMFQEAYEDGKKDIFLEKTTISPSIEVILLVRKGVNIKYAEK